MCFQNQPFFNKKNRKYCWFSDDNNNMIIILTALTVFPGKYQVRGHKGARACDLYLLYRLHEFQDVPRALGRFKLLEFFIRGRHVLSRFDQSDVRLQPSMLLHCIWRKSWDLASKMTSNTMGNYALASGNLAVDNELIWLVEKLYRPPTKKRIATSISYRHMHVCHY